MTKAPTETDEIKTFLVDELNMDGTWSRVSKKTGPNGETVRVFLNKDDNSRHYVVGVGGGEYGTLEADGPILFSIWENPNFNPEEATPFNPQYVVSFNSTKYWKKEKCLYDQHIDYILGAVLGLPDYLGEDQENMFSVEAGKTRQEIMDDLTDLGYVHSPEQEAWVQGQL